MKTALHALISIVLLLSSQRVIAQQQPSPPKTVPDSINYMWKMVESDFTSLAEAMPEEKWSFKPTQGAFTDVRTFGEQVKHVAFADRCCSHICCLLVPPGFFSDSTRSTAANFTRP